MVQIAAGRPALPTEVEIAPETVDLTPSITIGEAPYVVVLPDGTVLRGGKEGTPDGEGNTIRSRKQR